MLSKVYWTAIAAALLMSLVAFGQIESTAVHSRTQTIAELSKQLRWHSKSEAQHYFAAKDDLTRRVLTEIDAFIAETLDPRTTTADLVKNALDSLLQHNDKTNLMHDVVFITDLPAGRFLLVGVELWRGGEAISEDAISFRAYKQEDTKFALVAHTEDLHSSDTTNTFLDDLHAKQVQNPPSVGEFWFFGLANVPPQPPPTVAMRLYVFDMVQTFAPFGHLMKC